MTLKPSKKSFLFTAHAAEVVDIKTEVSGFFGYTCIGDFISNVVGVGITVAAIAVLIFLVWGGIEWITSGGDKAKIESAQKRISNAVVGLTIVVVAWALWKLALTFFGVDIGTTCSS